MALISSAIEIASSPAHVREVFLDFAKIPEWSRGFLKSIAATSPKGTIGKGDRLKVVLEGATFSPVILENTDREFKWRGSLWGLLNGDHSFRFEPSKITPGSTTFSQSEEFSGVLAFLMRLPHGQEGNMQTKFNAFNHDLKNRAESGV